MDQGLSPDDPFASVSRKRQRLSLDRFSPRISLSSALIKQQLRQPALIDPRRSVYNSSSIFSQDDDPDASQRLFKAEADEFQSWVDDIKQRATNALIENYNYNRSFNLAHNRKRGQAQYEARQEKSQSAGSVTSSNSGTKDDLRRITMESIIRDDSQLNALRNDPFPDTHIIQNGEGAEEDAEDSVQKLDVESGRSKSEETGDESLSDASNIVMEVSDDNLQEAEEMIFERDEAQEKSVAQNHGGPDGDWEGPIRIDIFADSGTDNEDDKEVEVDEEVEGQNDGLRAVEVLDPGLIPTFDYGDSGSQEAYFLSVDEDNDDDDDAADRQKANNTDPNGSTDIIDGLDGGISFDDIIHQGSDAEVIASTAISDLKDVGDVADQKQPEVPNQPSDTSFQLLEHKRDTSSQEQGMSQGQQPIPIRKPLRNTQIAIKAATSNQVSRRRGEKHH